VDVNDSDHLDLADPDDLALFAVDGLDTDELKAVEARLDGDGPSYLGSWREALGQLAALVADAPPSDLRTDLLSAARTRRAPGASLLEVGEVSSVEAFVRTITALDDLLGELSPGDWAAPTIEGWTVKGLATHLVAIEEYFGRQLGLWAAPVDVDLEADHLGMTRELVASWSDRPPAEVLARWRQLTAATTAHLRALDRSAMRRPFHFHYLDTTLSTVLITRVFEIWTHDEDIRRATGRTPVAPDAERLRRMSRVAVPSMAFALALGGNEAAGRTARIVLTGPGGGTWDQALGLGEEAGEPEATLVVDVVDYCRLAARRLDPEQVEVVVEGDAALARQVLAGAGVFSA
jgi:uncharacterized protein (TIGR03083 family)